MLQLYVNIGPLRLGSSGKELGGFVEASRFKFQWGQNLTIHTLACKYWTFSKFMKYY